MQRGCLRSHQDDELHKSSSFFPRITNPGSLEDDFSVGSLKQDLEKLQSCEAATASGIFDELEGDMMSVKEIIDAEEDGWYWYSAGGVLLFFEDAVDIVFADDHTMLLCRILV